MHWSSRWPASPDPSGTRTALRPLPRYALDPNTEALCRQLQGITAALLLQRR